MLLQPTKTTSVLARIVAWFTSRFTTITDHVFAGPDEFARRNGWSIEIRPGGMSRRYRDPRFDSFRNSVVRR